MTLGPNTNAPLELLSTKVILVCGEDRGYLLPYVGATPSHSFRCFEFWKMPTHTVILCGMGTGCVEPLIWEVIKPGIVGEIVLIGTAGKMPGTSVQIGQPYAVAKAWLAGTALDGERVSQPVKPRWTEAIGVEWVDSVSTDFFYGFAPRVLEEDGYPFASGPLALRYAEHLAMGTELVDMEVAAFYCFCEKFGDPGLTYLAIKGPSNELGADGQQIAETGDVMERCMAIAKRVLKIEKR